MPTSAPPFRPRGWQPPRRVRTDATDRSYGTQAWRKTAAEVIRRANGICALCGQSGADTADHIVPKREGGTDELGNLRAVHRGCHNERHGKRR